MFGLDFDNPWHAVEEHTYYRLFETIPLLSLTTNSSKKAAQLFKGLQKKGLDVGRFDSMIAAIFLENGITKIITANEKHFKRMKEFEVLSYSGGLK